MNKQVNLVRYVDDFVMTGISQEVLEKEVKPLVPAFLGERGLELSEEQPSITHIEEGFDFLGQTVRKYNGQFLTRPSKERESVPDGHPEGHQNKKRHRHTG